MTRTNSIQRCFRATASALLIGMAATGQATAATLIVEKSVFTSDNRSRLCPTGASKVTPAALAPILFKFVPGQDIVRANLGNGDDNEKALRFFQSPTPFKTPIGQVFPEEDRAVLEEALRKRDEILNISLAPFLSLGAGLPNQGYTVARFGKLGSDIAERFFREEADVQILCTQPAASAPQSETVRDVRFRLRGDASDLTATFDGEATNGGKDAYKAASSAEVSLTRNEASDKRSIEAKAVVGYAFGGFSDDGFDQIIPYLGYRGSRTAAKGATERISLAQVGVLYNWWRRVYGLEPIYSIEIDAAPVATFDREQDAEVFSLKAEATPGLAFGNFIFGQFNDVFGSASEGSWLLVYPDLRILAEANQVADAGRNPNLSQDDSFFGLGVNPRLQARLSTNTLLDRATVTAEYRYLGMISGVVRETERWSLGLNFRLDQAGDFNLSVNYVDGENPDSLQFEKFWGVKLGVKF